MKVRGNGQAKVLTSAELALLFGEGLTTPRDRLLFGVCLFTGCRISEALGLRGEDVGSEVITFRRGMTKGKLMTREVGISLGLRGLLGEYEGGKVWLFPGMRGHLSRFMADQILREACERVGLRGVSTHSFRRTALTQMHNAGVPLRHIQEISGHRSLATLQRYLEVSTEQKERAVAVIGW
ncbi:MAG: site-specific integrase [Snowella sp.]|nr:site-specific integrase [Snowella sp.]